MSSEPQNLLLRVRAEAKSKCIAVASHHQVHLSGESVYASLASIDSEKFHASHVEETFWDDVDNMLLKGSMILKCERNVIGHKMWSLKHDVEHQESNGTHYACHHQTNSVDEIIALLNQKFEKQANWIALVDEEDLSLRFSCLLVMYYCIKIQCHEWRNEKEHAYFEQIKIAPNVFYNLTTYSLNTSREVSNGQHVTNNDVLSKDLAALYHHNRPLFDKYFATPSSSPSFQSTTPLSQQFIEMAEKLSLLDQSGW